MVGGIITIERGVSMPIIYTKFFELLKERDKTMYDLRKDKVIGVATVQKMRKGSGSIDTRSIEKLCGYLACQPGDLMEYVKEE
jgi:putative transcriptional regulator